MPSSDVTLPSPPETTVKNESPPNLNIVFGSAPALSITPEATVPANISFPPVGKADVSITAAPNVYISALGSDAKGFVWKGPWDSRVNYFPYDVVQYETGSYVSLTANSNRLPTDNHDWDLLATGTVGPEGEPGPPGPQGTGITIKGTVASSVDLPLLGNTIGDMWITADTGHGWAWQADATWLDVGPVQGPPGPVGPKGDKGDAGSTGPPGPPVAFQIIWGETPSGTINGVNKNYASAYSYSPNQLAVFLNGMRLRRTEDYVEMGGQSFSFVSAPLSGDSLSIDYVRL